jgi:hypothetical protein
MLSLIWGTSFHMCFLNVSQLISLINKKKSIIFIINIFFGLMAFRNESWGFDILNFKSYLHQTIMNLRTKLSKQVRTTNIYNSIWSNKCVCEECLHIFDLETYML